MKPLKFSRNHLLTIALAGLLAFSGSWALSLWRGIPVPFTHDEFCHLLAADTFLHGRLTNPTPPLWINFETFHEIMRPSYMSKFPPGQALFLALGKIIFGHPVFGVWISDGLMCAAICWMLYAWVPLAWALIGGIVAVIEFGVFTYWSQSYWGGAVAAIGGALVFGAIPRIFKFYRTRDVLWLGLGLAVLFNTRPAEGIVLGALIGIVVLPRKIRFKSIPSSHLIRKIILPLSVCVMMMLAFFGFYNKTITGKASVSPYEVYQDSYFDVPVFIWQSLRPRVHFNNLPMEQYENDYIKKYFLLKESSWKGMYVCLMRDINVLFVFYLGYPLAVVALGALAAFHLNRKKIFLTILILMIFLLFDASLFCRAKVHYYASFTCLFVLLVVDGLRALSRIKFGRLKLGFIIAVLLIIFQLVFYILTCPPAIKAPSLARAEEPTSVNLPGSFTREELVQFLKARGGKYLIIVKYPPWHIYHWEWVFNDADIDHSDIVWARDLGKDQNAKLRSYYKDRTVCAIDVYWDSHISYNPRKTF